MIVTAVVVIVMVIALVRELASPAAVMVGALVALILAGVLPAEAAFAGVSSPATVSIAGLFIVARAMRDHAGLDVLLHRLLRDGSAGERGVLARIVPPIILLSGFANNTPIVAIGAPVLRSWAERNGVATTKLLMPLSFAAILGGMLTLIGTGPNLVVSALLVDAGYAPLDFFEMTPVGLPVAVIGGLVLIGAAPKLLPDRRTPHEQLASHQRDYTMRVTIEPGGPLEGTTIASAGLRDLPDAFIASVLRDDTPATPAAPDTVLHGQDEVVLVGSIDAVRDLLARPGLREAEHAHTRMFDRDDPRLVECIIGSNSELAGHTLKQVAFRGRYGGAVIAIHRAGTRLDGKLGTIELRAGDTLLVLTDPAYVERWTGHRDFAVIVPHTSTSLTSRDRRRRSVTLATFVGLIIVAATGLLPVVEAILAACAVLLAAGTITFGRAIDALDLDILLIVAAAIGVGSAITASGLTKLLADAAASVTGSSPIIALGLIVVTTILLTELITNVAAAALMLPIALQIATQSGAGPRAAAIAVAIAASASFLTPLGYQTNTIVYGVAGYRYSDYWKLGAPLTLTAVCLVIFASL